MPMEVEEHEAKDDSGRVFRVPNSSKCSGGVSEEKKENVNHTHIRNTKQLGLLKITSLSKLSKFSSPNPCSRIDVLKHINLNNYNLYNPSLWAKAKPNPEEPETMEWTNARARLGGRIKKMESVDLVTNVTYIPGVES